MAEFSLEPCGFKTLDSKTLKPLRVYRLVSTGKVMLSVWSGNGFTHVPALEGGFSGSLFFGAPAAWEQDALIVAGSPCDVEAVNPSAPIGGDLIRGRVEPGRPAVKVGLGARGGHKYILVKASGEISVMMGDTQWGVSLEEDLGDDLDVFGAASGEKVWFYVQDKAYVYVLEDETGLEIDGVSNVYRAGDIIEVFSRGFHVLTASKPVVVTVPLPDHRYDDWAAVLVSARDLAVSHRVPEPPSEEKDWWLTMATGAGALAALLLAVLIWRRRRS